LNIARRRSDRFAEFLRNFFVHGRPVVVTEFGCCTYQGAADAGGMGWGIVEPSQFPPKWTGTYVRDEREQADELADALATFEAAGMYAVFLMTFAAPLLPHSSDHAYDLDMASYSLVKSYAPPPAHPDGPWDATRRGSTYRDMPWEPKDSFHAVARFYAGQEAGGSDVTPVHTTAAPTGTRSDEGSCLR
jgi:hypothetical protein